MGRNGARRSAADGVDDADAGYVLTAAEVACDIARGSSATTTAVSSGGGD